MNAHWRELTESLRTNKLRTLLTGFTVAWGIIILVLMLGAGKGVENGIRKMIASFGGSQVQLTMNLTTTSKPYAGYQEGRELFLTPKQFQYLRESNASQVRSMEPTLAGFTVKEAATDYGSVSFRYHTLTLQEQGYNMVEMRGGRNFTMAEHTEGARVILISESAVSQLFQKGQDPIGQFVRVDGVSFQVVGLRKPSSPFFATFTIPYNTYATLYPNETVKLKSFRVYPRASTQAGTKVVENSIKDQLLRLLKIDPSDPQALWVEGSVDFGETMDQIFVMLELILWIMGAGSLSIGTIGVSNIMYVTIQERMREIGIRKALGAKPKDIMILVLGESVILSMLSGLVGLLIGFGLIELLDYLTIVNDWGKYSMPVGMGSDVTFTLFSDPAVNLHVAIGAVIVLVIAGLIAGYGPAKKAIKIPAIVAMRDTK